MGGARLGRGGHGSLRSRRSAIRLRTILLPVEHGGWGFLAEPILLGLLVAPSGVGWAIASMTVAGFLARHPAKMFIRNRHRLYASPRYRVAGGAALAYGGVALGAAGLTWRAAGIVPLLPFVALSPLLVVYAAYDLTNDSRRMLPVLAGPAGLAASGPAIALAGDWNPTAAAALWLILVARAAPAVAYVRSRLRLERREPIGRRRVWLWHGLALVGVGALHLSGLAPMLTVLALAGLFARALGGLSAKQPTGVKARDIGFAELGYGLAYVLLTALGFRLGL